MSPIKLLFLLPLLAALGATPQQGITPEKKKELAELRRELRQTAVLLAKRNWAEADQVLGDLEIRFVRWADSCGLTKRDPGLSTDLKTLTDWQTTVDSNLKVGAPPADLGLDPFYQKHIDFRGLAIVSSGKVPDAALVKARAIIREMVSKRPDVIAELVKQKVRVAIMAKTELTTDIPEHATLTPKDYWDKRARGLGASVERPVASGAEENLLGYPDDRYKGENIFLHEFSHTIHTMGLPGLDPGFDAAVQAAYEAAKKKGLWERTYAIENHREYFAEGVQSWFDANLESIPPNGIHNHVNTRKELEAYDPGLAALIRKVFP
ncbi:MAG: hypothetical protein JO332_01370 [Planctomycetaceae bacterium]|nr:hypothetical protein [Planctomycetaceae bacterium]